MLCDTAFILKKAGIIIYNLIICVQAKIHGAVVHFVLSLNPRPLDGGVVYVLDIIEVKYKRKKF